MTDAEILRPLAARYHEAAQSEENRAHMQLHRDINEKRGGRPIVLIDEIPWHEMNFDGSLTLRCQDPYLREVEQYLRRQLYQWDHMRADMVLPPWYGVEKVVHTTDCGVTIACQEVKGEEGAVQSHRYVGQFETMEDLQKLHNETVTYDAAETARRLALAEEAIGTELPVRVVGISAGYGTACKIWDDIAQLVPLEDLLMRLLIDPDFMHALAGKLTDILLDCYRQYDSLGLWETEAFWLHGTAALTDGFEAPDGNPARRNVWGRGLAQILSSVSPEMHEEFDIVYQQRAQAGFGRVYYGCCEPLDQKLEQVEKVPNLWKISISPWANVDTAAEFIGGRYVLAAKPSPSNLAGSRLDEDVVRGELRRIVDACRRNGCSCDIALKDISTVHGKPENLFRWQELAMEAVHAF